MRTGPGYRRKAPVGELSFDTLNTGCPCPVWAIQFQSRAPIRPSMLLAYNPDWQYYASAFGSPNEQNVAAECEDSREVPTAQIAAPPHGHWLTPELKAGI